MTFAEPLEREELWKRLQAYEFDKPGTVFTFAKRLARENNWSQEFAARAVEEYKRFVFLCMCEPPATPSFQVDQVWHLHLTFTRSYWGDFCGTVLARPLHHDPTMGGAKEHARYWRQYAATLGAYEAHFGPPPEDLWPSPSLRFHRNLKYRWVNPEDYWLVPKPSVVHACISRSQRLLQHALGIAAKLKELLRAAASYLVESRRLRAGSGAMVVAIAMACSLQTASAEGDSNTLEASLGVRNAFLGSLSGGQFLMLYTLAACLCHFAAACLRDHLREAGRREPSESNMDPYEVAMLQGCAEGKDAHSHTLKSCVLALVRRGWLETQGQTVTASSDAGAKLNVHNVRPASTGTRRRGSPQRRPLEEAVVGACSSPRTIESLEKEPPVEESLKDIAKQLSGKDLLMSRGASSRLKTWSCAPGFAVVFLLGLPRALGANGRPIEILLLLMLASGLLTHNYFVYDTPSQFPTKSGLKVLGDYKLRHDHLKGTVERGTSDQEAAMAFAIFGMVAVFPGSMLQAKIQPLLPAKPDRGAGGGCDDSGCSDVDSGCSGCGG